MVAEHLVGCTDLDGTDDQHWNGRGLLDFGNQEVSNLLWSFAQQGQLGEGMIGLAVSFLSHHDGGEQLLLKVCCACVDHLLEGNNGRFGSEKLLYLSQVVWALAVLGVHRRDLFDIVEAQTIER